MAYIGEIGGKVDLIVELVTTGRFTDYAFSYYGTEFTIYSMQDMEGNTLVWKTASVLSIEKKLPDGDSEWYVPKKGDKFRITGTIKKHSTYKDEEQTELSRVKLKEMVEVAIPYEEKRRQKQQEQLDSLGEGDFVWYKMPFKQFKEHYSDCETLYGSFFREEYTHRAVIDVIIRRGRLVPSGVRGRRFSGYQMQNELGQKTTYRAVTEENALKRVHKEHPEHTWECVKIFDYNDYHRVW